MTLGAGQVRELLDRHGITPSRALGQNFVVDPNTVRRIAEFARVGAGDSVLEIGPGIGSLTLALAETGAAVTAVELDRHVLPALTEVVEGVRPPVTVVSADALDVDYDALLAPARRWRLAANLPYNVGTTIFLHLLEVAPAIEGGVILVQREVADRLAAGPGDPAYGIPSVKAAWWIDARSAGVVPATVFHPRPRVESALVTFERHDPPGGPDERTLVFDLVDAGFGQRRKMVRRSLQGLATAEDLVAADIEPTARAEELALADWVRLSRHLRSGNLG